MLEIIIVKYILLFVFYDKIFYYKLYFDYSIIIKNGNEFLRIFFVNKKFKYGIFIYSV